MVFEKDRALLGVSLAHQSMPCIVDRALHHRMIEQAIRGHGPHDPARHIVKPCLGYAARGDRGLQRRTEIRLLVERKA